MWAMCTVRYDNRTHRISVHNADKEQYIYIYRDMLESVLSYTLTYSRNSSKLDNENWCEWVSHLVETSFEGKGTILQNQQVQTNRTILNNELDVTVCANEK